MTGEPPPKISCQKYGLFKVWLTISFPGVGGWKAHQVSTCWMGKRWAEALEQRGGAGWLPRMLGLGPNAFIGWEVDSVQTRMWLNMNRWKALEDDGYLKQKPGRFQFFPLFTLLGFQKFPFRGGFGRFTWSRYFSVDSEGKSSHRAHVSKLFVWLFALVFFKVLSDLVRKTDRFFPLHIILNGKKNNGCLRKNTLDHFLV